MKTPTSGLLNDIYKQLTCRLKLPKLENIYISNQLLNRTFNEDLEFTVNNYICSCNKYCLYCRINIQKWFVLTNWNAELMHISAFVWVHNSLLLHITIMLIMLNGITPKIWTKTNRTIEAVIKLIACILSLR